ncbi:MAG: cell wall-binding repeat-containing protein [Oscillospiraceae bacterium]|jgi:putative cell wall-binding protein|nr:cell wall-binding repeat-containing protein [Oscillospiraceae bacterium]
MQHIKTKTGVFKRVLALLLVAALMLSIVSIGFNASAASIVIFTVNKTDYLKGEPISVEGLAAGNDFVSTTFYIRSSPAAESTILAQSETFTKNLVDYSFSSAGLADGIYYVHIVVKATLTANQVTQYKKIEIHDTTTFTYDVNNASNYHINGTIPNLPYGHVLTVSSSLLLRDGFTFLGWSLSTAATAPTYFAGDLITVNTYDMTLHAVWAANDGTYMITYVDTNYFGSPIYVPSEQAKVRNVPLHLAYDRPYKPFFTFMGWSLSSSPDATVDYLPGEIITEDDRPDLVLYAVWREDTIFRWSNHYSFANTDTDFFKNPTTDLGYDSTWDSYRYNMSNRDFDTLLKYTKNAVYGSGFGKIFSWIEYGLLKFALQKFRKHSWGGSCYGMAVTELLNSTGQIDIVKNFSDKDKDAGKQNIRELVQPKYNHDLQSAINYYQISQVLTSPSYLFAYSASGGSISTGYKKLVESAKTAKEPIVLCYAWGSNLLSLSGHAVLVIGYEEDTVSGEHYLYVSDPNAKNNYSFIKISDDYKTFTSSQTSKPTYLQFFSDVYGFDTIDIDGPNNDMVINPKKAPAAISAPAAGSADYALLSLKAMGNIIATNSSGETLVFNSADGALSGTMEVSDFSFIVNSTVDDPDAPATMTFTVPNSEAFTFTSTAGQLDVAVLSNDFCAAVESSNAGSAVISNLVQADEKVDFTVDIGTSNTPWDMISFEGTGKTKQIAFAVSNGGVTIGGGGAESDTTMQTFIEAEASEPETIGDQNTFGAVRFSGGNRYETAANIAKAGWEQADTVILANGTSFADALAGGPLSKALDAPILLTGNGNALEDVVLQTIKDLKAKNIVILGGTSSVKAEFEKQLASSTVTVSRIQGDNRYSTAVEIAKTLYKIKAFDKVYVANGNDFPDALAAGPAAALDGCPILFTSSSDQIKLNSDTAAYINSIDVKSSVVLGGSSSVAEAVMNRLPSPTRLSGGERYSTSVAIYNANKPLFTANAAAVASGANFPDALAGSAYAAKIGAPLLLVNNKSVNAAVKAALADIQPDAVYIFGGPSLISDDTMKNYL